jgi:FeS assembly SUF system regulator
MVLIGGAAPVIRITRLSDYGIVLLSRFADAPEGEVLSARELADASGLPMPTVAKVLKCLTRGGLLLSHRGKEGGYSLARAAEAVSVADIIGAIEGPIALTECTTDDDGLCGLEPTCPVRRNWQRISTAVHDALSAIPLADMARPFAGALAALRARSRESGAGSPSHVAVSAPPATTPPTRRSP